MDNQRKCKSEDGFPSKAVDTGACDDQVSAASGAIRKKQFTSSDSAFSVRGKGRKQNVAGQSRSEYYARNNVGRTSATSKVPLHEQGGNHKPKSSFPNEKLRNNKRYPDRPTSKAGSDYTYDAMKPKYNQRVFSSSGYSAPGTSKSPFKNKNLPFVKDFAEKANSPRKPKFEPYISLFDVQQGLKRGEFIEGALRINPRSYEDAYISAPDGQMDIYIGGKKDRNRALNGDLVVVQVNPKQEWKVLCDAIKDYQDRHGHTIIESVYSPVSTPCKVHTPEKFSKAASKASSMWNEPGGVRPPDTLDIIGVDKLADQLEGLSMQSKTKNRRKRQRHKNKDQSDLSSRESSNQQSSTTSNSHGSSDDILSKMSSDISPEHQLGSVLHDNNVPEDCKGSSSSELPENVVNGYTVSQGDNVPVSEHGQKPPTPDIQTSNESQSTDPWNAPNDSLNIITSPEALLDFENDNQIEQLLEPYQYNHKWTSSEEDNNRNECVIVAPHDLSGDEYTDSLSSVSSAHGDQLEDTAFFESQQDAQNNNADNLQIEGSTWNTTIMVRSNEIPYSTPTNTVSYVRQENITSAYNCQKEVASAEVLSSIEVLVDCVSSSSIIINERESTPQNLVHVETHPVPVSKPSVHFKKRLETKKNTISKSRKKKKPKILKVTSETSNTPVVRDAPVFHNRTVESLTVEEVMQHPLWERFVQKTGKVVYILERKHSRVAVGHIKLLQDKNSRFALFSPKDNRLPRLMIPMLDCPHGFYERPQDFNKFIFLARIEDWKESDTFASGHLIKNLGDMQQIGPQTEGILRELDVDFEDFSPEVLSCLPSSSDWHIPESELSKRVDYRNACVFTIDPATARDMDDAVSCELLENGNFKIGVHIADVSYFVTEGTPLDECAKRRATSVYMVQQVIPMLPRVLCDNLCSLTPGEDRLTFSVLWEITPEAEILTHHFERSVINSCLKLSYDHAQEMIENPDKAWEPAEHPTLHGQFKISDVIQRVLQLNSLAMSLRKRRFDDGALRLDQTKLQFTLCRESGLPVGFTVYEQKDSNRLIEEFMLLANITVAHRIHQAFPKLAVLRRHPPPQTKPMADVVKMCSYMGIHLDSSSSGSLQSSISRYLGEDSWSQSRGLILTHLCSKPMNCALYFCSGELDDVDKFHHYALNVPLYTHFTSPIRRYPDIIVHRLLSATFLQSAIPTISSRLMQKQAEHCNDKKLCAKRASELSDELFLAAFILECGPIEVQAMVINVMDHSFDCLVLHFGIVKRVYCDKLNLLSMRFEKIGSVPSLSIVWKAADSEEELTQKIIMFAIVNLTLSTSEEMTILAKLQLATSKPQSHMPLT